MMWWRRRRRYGVPLVAVAWLRDHELIEAAHVARAALDLAVSSEVQRAYFALARSLDEVAAARLRAEIEAGALR